MNQLSLRDQDKQRLQQLITDYLPDIIVWGYGSRVTGAAHEASDLDIVLRSKDLSPIPTPQFKRFIEAVRESNIPILIDVHDWVHLPASFHKEILKNHVELNTVASVGYTNELSHISLLN
jgi:predicted nucleotidyltransferase